MNFLYELDVKPEQSIFSKIKTAIVYAVLAEVPPCAGYKSWTDCGYEYDCEYGGEVDCDDCICGVGSLDPRTGNKFKKLRRYI